MTREIKFRAWDKKQNKMLYGVSIGTIKVWDENAPLISHEFSYSEDCVFEQYTGLKDKNGIEIYEGDIVEKCYNKAKKLYSSAPVEFKHGKFESGGWTLCKFAHKCEIIGNIHENPELLEGERV